MTEKYVLEVDIDYETGEEHCTVLKTDGTTNMENWIEIVSVMYTHHSILEILVDELNKLQNNYDNNEKYAIKLWEENEEFKKALVELKEIGDYQEGRIKELDKENQQLEIELKGMEQLLRSYRKTIKHDAKLLADATKNGYLPPLEDWMVMQ